MSNEMNTNRRGVLKLVAAGLAGMAALPKRGFAQEPAPAFHKPDSPQQAMELLAQGNQRFVAHNLTSFEVDLALLRADSEEHQEPFAAILSCADSRVPPELVFDQSLGHLFVVRVAGNVATNVTTASLEYGAAVLGVKAILVLGHTNCGAIKAAAAGKEVPGQISTLFQYIHPAVTDIGSDMTAGSRKNAMLQASTLRKTSPVLSKLVTEKKLLIQAALYDVGNGKVTMLEG
jgi:carbonic anhydrase